MPSPRVALPGRLIIAAALLSVTLAAVLVGVVSSQQRSPFPGVRYGNGSRLGLSSLPLPAQGTISGTLGAGDQRYAVSDAEAAFRALNPAQRLSARFGPQGIKLNSGRVHLGLSVAALGYGGSLQTVGDVAPSASGNRVLYARAGLDEWFANGPLGLEQGFTILKAPARTGPGPLSLSMSLSGDARPVLADNRQSLTFSLAGKPVLRYGDLLAVDARGRTLPSWLEMRRGQVLLRVATHGARYPLRIDPLIQQAELKGGEETGEARFGYSVALAANGETALVGGMEDNGRLGAAWVFTRSGSSWTQQGPKLTGSAEETGSARFGGSVALSSDGNTALIGGSEDNKSVGAAWVFTRSGSTWTQQGPKLTGGEEVGTSEFGTSVALSSDGNTALMGGDGDNHAIGAAWVFTRSGSTWTQQGPKLTGSGETGAARFGEGVALSSEGNTALMGGPFDGTAGAAWVFTRSGSTWTQQGPKLTGGEAIGESLFGLDVALSGDGNTGLVGGYRDHTGTGGHGIGAAWVFTRSGSTWTQQGPKLTGSGEIGEADFGYAVALSSEGNTALIGGPDDNKEIGAAWVFTRSGSTWTQEGEKLTSSGGSGLPSFGISTALSANGNAAVIGSASGAGAAWVFSAPSEAPEVVKVEPRSGLAAGGTSVTITGANFTGATAVKFGATNATSFTVNSANSITAVSPAGTGTVDVTVTTPKGTSATGSADQFTYGPTVAKVEPSAGGTAGGTSVTITGTNLTGATAVKFGSTNATSFMVNSATSVTAVSPGGTGTVDVTVTTPEGTSPTGSADLFTYVVAVPTVTKVEPNSGPTAGGTSVTITGTNFTAATAVKFGSANATSFTVNSASSITAVSPAGTGTVDVTVTTPEGTSAPSTADQFTYGPTVTKVEPSSGSTAGGTSVTITGTNLTGATAVKFGATNATSFTVNSASSITAVSPAGSGTVDVTVTTPEGTSPTGSADRFTYGVPAPFVSSLSPNSGPAAGGTTVTITGTSFTGTTAVHFGSQAVSFTLESETTIKVVSPPFSGGSAAVNVSVTTPAGTSEPAKSSILGGSYFRYAPTVTSVEPNSGPSGGGTPVRIRGTGFYSVRGPDELLPYVEAVYFGTTRATSFTASEQPGPGEVELTAVAPPGTGSEDVSVETYAGKSPANPADQFTFLSTAPTVTKVEPSVGSTAGGTSVTVTGTNFSGASAVKFGSTNATSFTVNSATSITAVSPAGSGKVDVTVTTPSGTSATSSADQFTYSVSACTEDESAVHPVVTSVEPKAGPAAGGSSVTIRGEHFTVAIHCALSPVKRVMFGTKEASFSYVHEGPNHEGELVATAPSGTGTVDITVETLTTSAASPADQFTYEAPPPPPAPKVTGVEPGNGPQAGGTSVKISGENFTGATAVKFGTSNATSFTVNSGTSITAVAPAFSRTGSALVDVSVTTPAGTSPTGPLVIGDGFGYQPTVTSVSPATGPASGGTSVRISGAAFAASFKGGTPPPCWVCVVKFGSANATSFKVLSEGEIEAVAPPGRGTVDITVQTLAGTSSAGSADQFSYEPPTVHGEFSNWVLSGALHIRKLNQEIALPEGSRFNGTASINLETQSGPLSGTVTVPGFNAMLKILGTPATVGMEFTQVGSIEGSIAASTAIPGDFSLSLPTRANIGFSSITIFGLKIATKCVTSEPLAFNLLATLPLEELLSTGAQFMGTTKFPTVKCEGTNGSLVSSILTSLFSGPSNPYSFTIGP